VIGLESQEPNGSFFVAVDQITPQRSTNQTA
jgi:hypothetical protein